MLQTIDIRACGIEALPKCKWPLLTITFAGVAPLPTRAETNRRDRLRPAIISEVEAPVRAAFNNFEFFFARRKRSWTRTVMRYGLSQFQCAEIGRFARKFVGDVR